MKTAQKVMQQKMQNYNIFLDSCCYKSVLSLYIYYFSGQQAEKRARESVAI